MRKCKNCKHSSCGAPDPCCDICDECRHDGDTGWCGFTDHSVGKHFYTEDEQKNYYKNHDLLDDDDDNFEI
jgi:hypothetical protein